MVEHARRGWCQHRERPLAFDGEAKGRLAIINQSGAAAHGGRHIRQVLSSNEGDWFTVNLLRR
jgi:hypothetical protein